MQSNLSEFLSKTTRLVEGTINMGVPMHETDYLCNQPPPLEYVSSVRAIVFREQSVLVITQKNGEQYIVPGGRVERGEKPLETLKRELLEETGWSLGKAELLGGMHFHHLGPKPEAYPYPYPDFIWPVYIAEAREFTPETIQPDDWVSTSSFQPIEEVLKLPLNARGQLLLLKAALELR